MEIIAYLATNGCSQDIVERPDVVVAKEYVDIKSSSRMEVGESGVTGGVFGVLFSSEASGASSSVSCSSA